MSEITLRFRDPMDVKVTVLCNCGCEHPSFEDWQKCPMALKPRAVDNAWWRVLAQEPKS